MTRQEVIDFINAHPACFLATVEGDAPHVRGMLAFKADEKGILFHTGDFKELPKQMAANPNVEVCFNDMATRTQVRVAGKAERVEDGALKEEIVAKRPFLKPWTEKSGLKPLIVFRVGWGRVKVWTMETNFSPSSFQAM